VSDSPAIGDLADEMSLAELLEDGVFIDGDWIESKDQDPHGEVRLIQLADVGDGLFRNRSSRFLTAEKARELRCTFLEPGDILVARMPEPLGRACIFPGVDQPAVTAVDVCIVRPNPDRARPEWLVHAINAPHFRSAMEEFIRGTTRQRISRKNLGTLTLQVPSIDVQVAVAAAVEHIEARRRNAAQRIVAARAALDRFRGAVVTWVCSGLLTGDEPARRATPWPVVALADVCSSIADGDHQAPPQTASGIPFVTISAMNDGHLKLERATRFVPQAYYDDLKATRRPQVGDVLFSVTGSIGIPALVETEQPFTFQRHIAILRPDNSKILNKYLLYALGTTGIREQALVVATGTAQLTIPLGGLRAFEILLPSLAEQEALVRQIESLLSLGDLVRARVSAAQQRLEQGGRAALGKAFRGELVASLSEPNGAALR
jgi:type I restriction enzyme S subunit